MIRRDIQLGDDQARWLIVSQTEHARLSGELARHCNRVIGANLAAEQMLPVRAEVQEAIHHHDDGWLAWDSSPGLDPSSGRPLSFRELPLEESLKLWDASIDRCAEIGPLAGWVVASHFCALLAASTREHEQALIDGWLPEVNQSRDEWLKTWQAEKPELYTRELEEEALLHLQVFDVMSLWLPLMCPCPGEQWPATMEPYRIGEGTPLQAVLTPTIGRVHVEPWLFDLPELALEAEALVVPARTYRDGAELLKAGQEYQLQWVLADK